MAGDADMDRDEMVARIAVLEALVLKLLEFEARRLEKDGGKPALDGLLYSLGQAVSGRCQNSPAPQAQFASAHIGAIAQALLVQLEPTGSAMN